jgi:hypothetical protein
MTTFTVQYKRQVLRVRLLPDIASVHKLFKTTDRIWHKVEKARAEVGL